MQHYTLSYGRILYLDLIGAEAVTFHKMNDIDLIQYIDLH